VPSLDPTAVQGSESPDGLGVSSRWRSHSVKRVPRLDTIIRSRHSRRIVPTNRSAKAFARGARTGVRITRMPSGRKTSSKLAVNLASRSRIKNLTAFVRLASTSDRLRACWVTHSRTGLAVTPATYTLLVSSSMKKNT
jgi:hypothetical protein